MSAELDQGDWFVEDGEDTPGYVKIRFAEIDESGVQYFAVHMTPDGADEFADKIKEFAQWVRENYGD